MAGNIATSTLSTLLRMSNGIRADAGRAQPALMLKLYDIEQCPYCRLVREVLTELDLDADIYPCPKQGERFRPELVARGGKAQFPYLIDPNTGVEMYESLDIIEYLFANYGGGSTPLKWRAGGLQTFGSMLAGMPRLSRGMRARPGALPNEPLELYSFESSPYARVVREELYLMEIPYRLRNCGRTQTAEWLLPSMRERLDIPLQSEQANRRALLDKEGRVSIPYLFDPNTNRGMFESADIVAYLQNTYGS